MIGRRRMVPTAADLAAIHVDIPEEGESDDERAARYLAAEIKAERPLCRAFLAWTSERGEVVGSRIDEHIGRLRELGAVHPDKRFLSPDGIAARAKLLAAEQARIRESARKVK